jgi:hypothetical protein
VLCFEKPSVPSNPCQVSSEQSNFSAQSSIVFPSTKALPIHRLNSFANLPSVNSMQCENSTAPPKTLFSNGATAIIRPRIPGGEGGKVYLDESNVRGLLSEALTADVQSIFADQTSFVSADTAISQLSAPAPIFSHPIHSSPCSEEFVR